MVSEELSVFFCSHHIRSYAAVRGPEQLDVAYLLCWNFEWGYPQPVLLLQNLVDETGKYILYDSSGIKDKNRIWPTQLLHRAYYKVLDLC
jgi:hypothetical protein